MSNKRRHNANEVPIRALSPWLVFALILLVGGMTWVHSRNQLVTRGREIKEMEKQLRDLTIKNEALRPRIAALSSRTALQRRISDGFIKMVPITQDRIVQVNFTRPLVSALGEEMRAVSNEGIGR